MKTVRKTLTDEQKATIVEALEDKYGLRGEDFEVLFVSIRGQEKAYAVKSPNRMVWNSFRNDVAGNKKKATDIETNLAVDCLITDVEGCASLADFKQDIEDKPALSTSLSGKVAGLATSGLDGEAKKD